MNTKLNARQQAHLELVREHGGLTVYGGYQEFGGTMVAVPADGRNKGPGGYVEPPGAEPGTGVSLSTLSALVRRGLLTCERADGVRRYAITQSQATLAD